MEQYVGKVKVTNSEEINPFFAVVFADDAVKAMKKTGMTGEVVAVHVTKVEQHHLCASITTVDSMGNTTVNRYVSKF